VGVGEGALVDPFEVALAFAEAEAWEEGGPAEEEEEEEEEGEAAATGPEATFRGKDGGGMLEAEATDVVAFSED